MTLYVFALAFVAFFAFAGLVAKLDERADRKYATVEVDR